MKTETVTPLGSYYPTDSEIREKALELYIRSGWIPGRDLDNWLEAEAFLLVHPPGRPKLRRPPWSTTGSPWRRAQMGRSIRPDLRHRPELGEVESITSNQGGAMKSPDIALRVGSIVAGIACAAHLVRVLAEIPVRIGSFNVGLWPSAIVIVVAGGLSGWFWRLARHGAKSPPPA